MKIFHDSNAESLHHEGAEYTADDKGLFEVPEEVGRGLLSRLGWHEHVGGPAPGDNEALKARIAELEAQLEQATAPPATAAPADPPKK